MTYNLHKHREIQEAQIDNVELIKSGKGASIRFESPEVTFSFIAIFVAFGVITPWVFDVRFWRHNRRHAKGFGKTTHFRTAAGPVYQYV
ncbi:MAG: hypothetical protein LBD33_03510 [Puniceicoccales bacterium]|jgi:hypothetical protein|nr:hypothetical protein [Puniceicoccales bacterium]